MKKRAPKINSDVCFTKILSIVKNYLIYWNQKIYLKNVVAYAYSFGKKIHALMFESIYTCESTNKFIYKDIRIDLWLFPVHPFSTPWIHQKTVRVSDVFRG